MSLWVEWCDHPILHGEKAWKGNMFETFWNYIKWHLSCHVQNVQLPCSLMSSLSYLNTLPTHSPVRDPRWTSFCRWSAHLVTRNLRGFLVKSTLVKPPTNAITHFFVYNPIYLTSLTLMFKLLLDIILATGPPLGHEHDPILSPIFSPSNGTLHQYLGPKQNRKPNGMDGELSYTAPHISTMFPVYAHFSTLFPLFFPNICSLRAGVKPSLG